MIMKEPKPHTVLFQLGQTCMTTNAGAAMEKHDIDPAMLLARHINGDFGELDAEDLATNIDAMANEARIFSVYNVNGVKLWVITEADRSVTTILLPEDY